MILKRSADPFRPFISQSGRLRVRDGSHAGQEQCGGGKGSPDGFKKKRRRATERFREPLSHGPYESSQ
jgi:hypothetical protein